MAKIIEYTDSGIVTMTESEIYALIVEKQQEIDPNWNLDVSTPDGYMAAWHAENYRILVESIREAWNSKDPSRSRDAQLATIGLITGSEFEDGTPSIVNIEVGGADGTVVLSGSVISGGETWTVDGDITIGALGVGAGTATCAVTGTTDPDQNTITNIDSTIGGWSSVTNTSLNTLGTDKESNAAFRVKRTRSVARPGNNQVDNTIGEIFSVEDVLRVVAYENPTGSASVSPKNPYGLPANSVSYVVQGGADDPIAKSIFIKKNPGVNLNSVGTPVSVTVTSEIHTSNSQIIDFGRPSTVEMIVSAELADPLNNLPANIEELIQNAIIDYSLGTIPDDEEGFDNTGFDIGEDVPVRRIDTPINYVIGQYKGAYISDLEVNGVSSGVVDISFDEISTWSESNISVTVV
ncbi:baseplate wedge subunit [Vibrio phage K133]